MLIIDGNLDGTCFGGKIRCHDNRSTARLAQEGGGKCAALKDDNGALEEDVGFHSTCKSIKLFSTYEKR